ncbi:MAG: DNA polymerase III subunit alpha [Pseudomonadota bacterium]
MKSPSFVHLRLHSEYSIVDGIVRLDGALDKAAADNMPALALTDLGNLFGMVKFYQAARNNGIKPVIGCDVWLANDSDADKPHRLLLLCQSRVGYLRLCELLSRAYRENQRRGRAEIDRRWLAEGSEGLIALSGAHLGDVGQALLAGHAEQAEVLAAEWNALFPQRYYLELQRTGQPQAEACVQHTLRLARKLGLPVVATHPIQFLDADDYRAHEARVCIAEGYILADRRRPQQFAAQQYFKTQAEMVELFADVPQALANSVEIAKRCNLTLELGKNYLPRFPTPDGMSLDDYLKVRAAEGLEKRLRELFPDEAQRAAQAARYRQQLEFEVGTIVQMGFPGYFLIVADFINWAKQNGVPVGPGRGSGAGSLVAYSLGITNLDPLRYDLLFERFLNPERVSMPDFDIDFCQDGRERVIDYVKRKYGSDSVAQIATFGTMASKAVIRDVGRVLDMPYNFCDQLSKMIPLEGVKPVSLKKALELEPQLKERYEAEEEVRELFELASKLEDLTRNVGMHAGGVLIAPGKLSDFCPLYCAEASDSVVSQFDKDDVEKIGLVKFDFLGLRTLTIIDWAVRFIRAAQPAGETPFSIEHIPLDDAATYALLKRCDTTAVFQLESRGMKDLVRRLQPDCFDDIVALVALFRPGPLQSGMVDDFIARKHGKARVDYMHAQLEPVLKPTYGVIVYQEQVMQIAQILGGYSLGAADLLRRAMGKKKPEEMAKHRDIFVSGAVERKVTRAQAEHLFDLMEKFAEYGFNKSHSAAYALVAYQTAYLKAHYPAAFMSATLSADMDDTDKVCNFYQDSVANGLEILPPDINLGNYRFEPVSAMQIRYGLGAVKGTGAAAIENLVEARKQGGPFRDLFDFCRRVDKRIVNRRVIESLIRAGAFDALNDNRACLLASVGAAMETAEQVSRSANQSALFELDDEVTRELVLLEVPTWGMRERLQHEKMALGFYLSGHPFEAYEREVRRFVKTPLADLAPSREASLAAGVVIGMRIQQTRRGRMAVVLLDDGSAQVEATVFNELFEANRGLLKEDELLVVEGKVSEDTYSGGMRITVDKLYDITGARNRYAKGMRLTCNGAASGQRLKEVLTPYRSRKPGEGCAVSVLYRNGKAACTIELGEAWRVNLQDNLLHTLTNWLHEENVSVIYERV